MNAPDAISRLNAALEGRYRIERALGEGGMATVYVADDLKHERKVAVKVLKPDLAAAVGAERFLAEIKTTANLQHPHILPLFDSGDADGLLYYVTPFIDGETLREYIARQAPLDVDEAVELTAKIAAALEYAHQQGVIHRDIKPGNILLDRRSEPLVADFGIALVPAENDHSRLTETHFRLGTPSYMSPEQASSGDADERSDVYSLACVAFEMLIGDPPFGGSSPQALLAKKLTEAPRSLRAVRPAIPAHVDVAVSRALCPDREDRFSAVDDFAVALVEGRPLAGSGSRLASQSVAGALLVAIGAAAFVGITGGRDETALVPVPSQLTFDGNVSGAAISPNGQRFAYVVDGDSTSHLYVRDVAGGQAVRLHSARVMYSVDWSPDGNNLLLRAGPTGADNQTYVVPANGGSMRRLAAPYAIGTWSPDGTRAVSWHAKSTSLVYTAVASNDTSRSGEFGSTFEWLNALDVRPGDEQIVAASSTGEQSRLWTVDRTGAGHRDLLRLQAHLHSPRWSSTGRAIYYLRSGTGGVTPDRANDLWRLAVSRSGEPEGDPHLVLASLGAWSIHSTVPAFTISDDGERLLYVRRSARSNLWSWTVGDAAGTTGDWRQLTTGTAAHSRPRLSPDGGQVAYVRDDASGSNVFSLDLGSRESRQLTFLEAPVWSPAWSPDGERIAFGTTWPSAPSVAVLELETGTVSALEGSETSVGNRIAWAPWSRLLYQRPEDSEYHIVRPGTNGEEQLMGAHARGWVYNPRPLDDELVTAYWTRPPESGLYLIGADGAPPRLVIRDHTPIGAAAEPGQVFAMRGAFDEPSAEIVLVFIESGDVQGWTVLPVAVAPTEVSISRDGRTVVANVAESDSDVWLVEGFDTSR